MRLLEEEQAQKKVPRRMGKYLQAQVLAARQRIADSQKQVLAAGE